MKNNCFYEKVHLFSVLSDSFDLGPTLAVRRGCLRKIIVYKGPTYIGVSQMRKESFIKRKQENSHRAVIFAV